MSTRGAHPIQEKDQLMIFLELRMIQTFGSIHQFAKDKEDVLFVTSVNQIQDLV
ncbi:hypothetical protein TanjilG_11509 [Lupinus angustifolius]|uniref:Uncharacterized protein n=1 Tax=Lupinus angustifolius TaxID=3871 RepID=A0A1J7H1P4_LUPAN|nr:hypothetical protein TanjilG_11509 [Lupinus angustifolius]